MPLNAGGGFSVTCWGPLPMSKSLLPPPPQLVEGTSHKTLAGMRNVAERPRLLVLLLSPHLGKVPLLLATFPGELGHFLSLWGCQIEGDTHSTKLSLGIKKNFFFFVDF